MVLVSMPYVLLVWAELAVGVFDMLKSSFIEMSLILISIN